MPRGIAYLTLLGLMMLIFRPTPVQGENLGQIVVKRSNGRVASGVVDPQSDGDRLWLRSGSPDLILVRGIRWDEIERATLDEQAIDLDSLRSRLRELVSEPPAPSLPTQPLLAVQRPRLVQPEAGRESAVAKSLQLVAVVADWDADVEMDGLEILVIPRDERGNVAKFDGTLRLRLVGRRFRRRPYPEFAELEVTSIRLTKSDFDTTRQGYVVRMPFSRANPEFDTSLSPEALLSVRLNARGHGLVETSIPVWIRQFSPLRDQLQRETGTRFFSRELTRSGSGLRQ
ncbi:MAG: hypothetical protein KDA60_01560 [Planctomycetales bacterium]|nr:hypothetical protein [Planctomycetales bacterium]